VLILTRKINQAILVDGRAVIRVLDIEDYRVKIGVDAPAETKILREELTLGKEADIE